MTVTLVLAGCASSDAPLDSLPTVPSTTFQHIHELEINAKDGSLLVATHEGLYRLVVSPTGVATMDGPVAGLDFDPMGFTVVEGVAYASGHPGPTTPSSFGSPNLGLITSTDLGETWTNVSLRGLTDFHGLTVMAEEDGMPRVFGMDPSKQRIQRSMDGGQTWSDGSVLVARDILASEKTLYATTPEGLAESADYGTTFELVPDAPALYVIAADSKGALAGVDTAGTVWVRELNGTWAAGGATTGAVEAVAVSGGRIYVADGRGISSSDDSGVTWAVLVEQR
ncbi:MAG: F510_1955 family glycosylhydrolase [Microbacteriaceae bacterium]